MKFIHQLVICTLTQLFLSQLQLSNHVIDKKYYTLESIDIISYQRRYYVVWTSLTLVLLILTIYPLVLPEEFKCYPNKSLLRRLLPSSLHSPPTSMGMGISCLLALETMSPNRTGNGGQPMVLLHIRRPVLIVSLFYFSTFLFRIDRASAIYLRISS